MAEVTRVRSRDSTASRDLKKGEYGYPSGHLGHLTVGQEGALIAFKSLLKEKGLLEEGQDGDPDSHDDVTLLRYLRARRFVPKDALQQFADTEKWRETNQIDSLYHNIDVHEYNETWKLYPQWTGRRDKRGLPLYVFEVAPLNAKRMAEYAKNAATTTVVNSERDHNNSKAKGAVPPKLYRLFALYENLTNFAMPLCTALRDRPVPRTPISQANNIVDISHVGLKQFWNLRGHMQDASVLATAHYPETLDRIFIVGAPAFFPTVWEWIKRWFDPITVSKIFILSESQAYKTLSNFIDAENIPKKYGGKLPFEFGGGPILDPHLAEQLTFAEPGSGWPRGPVLWEKASSEDEEGPWKLMAVGSVDGKERRQEVATFTPDPIPPPEVDDMIREEAPDRSIDFATSTVKINPRASWASSRPPSPTALRRPSGPPSPVAAYKELAAPGATADAPKEPTGAQATPDAAADGPTITEKAGNVAAAAPGNPAKLPPVVTRVGDVPLGATATALPDAQADEARG